MMVSGSITSWQIDGEKMGKVILFSQAPKTLQMVTTALKLKDTCFLEKKNYGQPRQYIKKQEHHFADKVPYSQSYGFPGSHVWI